MNNTIARYDYRLSETVYIMDGRAYTVYGMTVHRNDGQDTLPVRKIPNISLSMTRVSRLVETCNRLQPSLLHLDDILEDCLP